LGIVQQYATDIHAATARGTRDQRSEADEGPVVRFGVIGYGYWGPQLVRNLDRLRAGRVECVAELSSERRRAARYDFPSITLVETVDELFAHHIDAVVIATPIRTHYQLAQQALKSGKHVFVEKPLADSSERALELIGLADDLGLTLMVGHTFLYNPAVEELRRLVQDGELGRVYYANAARTNLGIFQPDINVIWDLAPHDISILGYVFGAAPLRVSAHGSAFIRPCVQDVAHMTLQYPGDILAHIHVSWLSPSKERRFTMVGDQRMVVYDDVAATEKIRVFDRGVDSPHHTSTFGEFQLSYRYGEIKSPHINWAEPLAVECHHFTAAILEGTHPKSDGRNGLQVVRVLEAADASLAADGAFIAVAQGKE
jgi:predicted dehydrogenase